MTSQFLPRAIATATLATLGTVALPASANVTFNLTYLQGTSVNAQAGFQAAANLWSALFADNVTINLTVGLEALPANVLGSTGSAQGRTTYGAWKTALTNDATSTDDNTAVANLPAGSAFSLLINRTADNPNGSGSATPYRDNNNDANNTSIRATTALAKAVGITLTGATNPCGAGCDARISFATGFEPDFDYDRSDGIGATQFDFIGIAAHEIGHALGFISGVDILDINSPPVNGPFNANLFTFVSPLDLFRCSALSRQNNSLDWTADTRTKDFSIDGCNTSLATFSTGTNFGDGRQASHWKDNLGIGIMDPTAARGELLAISAMDLRGFDVMGWNLVRDQQPVPEPGVAGLLLLSLAGVAVMRRRRR